MAPLYELYTDTVADIPLLAMTLDECCYDVTFLVCTHSFIDTVIIAVGHLLV